jgi:hypothetical protein
VLGVARRKGRGRIEGACGQFRGNKISFLRSRKVGTAEERADEDAFVVKIGTKQTKVLCQQGLKQ